MSYLHNFTMFWLPSSANTEVSIITFSVVIENVKIYSREYGVAEINVSVSCHLPITHLRR